MHYHRVKFDTNQYDCYDMMVWYSEAGDAQYASHCKAMIRKDHVISWASLLRPDEMTIDGQVYTHTGDGKYVRKEIKLP